jgi:hypothetical protein
MEASKNMNLLIKLFCVLCYRFLNIANASYLAKKQNRAEAEWKKSEWILKPSSNAKSQSQARKLIVFNDRVELETIQFYEMLRIYDFLFN